MRAWKTWSLTAGQASYTEPAPADRRNFEFSTGRDYSRGLFL